MSLVVAAGIGGSLLGFVYADLLAAAKSGQEVALVFGNETAGLSNEDVQRCQRAVLIPANPEYSSLNLGAAVQLLCYELRMAAFEAAPPVVDQVADRLELALAAGIVGGGGFGHGILWSSGARGKAGGH